MYFDPVPITEALRQAAIRARTHGSRIPRAVPLSRRRRDPLHLHELTPARSARIIVTAFLVAVLTGTGLLMLPPATTAPGGTDVLTAAFTATSRGPSLPAGDVASAEERRLAARDAADALGLPIGNAVDFWTEASLFSQAGYTTFVFGPGDIAQAHTADEYVLLSQLDDYARHVHRIIDNRTNP